MNGQRKDTINRDSLRRHARAVLFLAEPVICIALSLTAILGVILAVLVDGYLLLLSVACVGLLLAFYGIVWLIRSPHDQ